LDAAEEADDEYGVVGALYTFGWLEILSGEPESARGRFVAALGLAAEGDALSVAQQLEGIAVAGMAANPRRAVTLFGAASRLRDEVEIPVQFPWSIWLEPAIAEARQALPPDAGHRAWESGRALPMAQVLTLAREQPGAARARGATGTRTGGLSKREVEVARLVASGMTSRAIAERLFLSERTVESHIEHILTKLGFSSRAQVASWATQSLRTEEQDT
jgi:non-specific serine/threonine protein kinase